MAKRSRLVDETDAARAAEAIDVSRAEAPVGRASSRWLRVDRWYDRFARSWCVRIVDSTGAQQGDALFSGTREGADAHERDLRARIEAPAAASARRWRASGPAVIDEHDRLVCVVEQTPSRPSAEEAAAIARLIAKAPDLLEACEEMVYIHTQNNAGPDAESRFRQVAIRVQELIAAAKGGAS